MERFCKQKNIDGNQQCTEASRELWNSTSPPGYTVRSDLQASKLCGVKFMLKHTWCRVSPGKQMPQYDPVSGFPDPFS